MRICLSLPYRYFRSPGQSWLPVLLSTVDHVEVDLRELGTELLDQLLYDILEPLEQYRDKVKLLRVPVYRRPTRTNLLLLERMLILASELECEYLLLDVPQYLRTTPLSDQYLTYLKTIAELTLTYALRIAWVVPLTAVLREETRVLEEYLRKLGSSAHAFTYCVKVRRLPRRPLDLILGLSGASILHVPAAPVLERELDLTRLVQVLRLIRYGGHIVFTGVEEYVRTDLQRLRTALQELREMTRALPSQEEERVL